MEQCGYAGPDCCSGLSVISALKDESRSWLLFNHDKGGGGCECSELILEPLQLLLQWLSLGIGLAEQGGQSEATEAAPFAEMLIEPDCQCAVFCECEWFVEQEYSVMWLCELRGDGPASVGPSIDSTGDIPVLL